MKHSSLLARAAAILLLLTGSSYLTRAQTQTEANSDYAILIVGDESDPTVRAREKVLIQEIAKRLHKQPKLPLYSYHFNQERERTYCEKKLNVLKEDLLFMGIVTTVDRRPQKVVYRLDRIVTPARAAQDILARADELEPETTETPTASPSPEPTASPTNTPAPGTSTNTTTTTAPGRYRVQLGVFTQQKFAQDLVDQLKSKGYDAKFDKTATDGRETFKVWVGTFPTKEDAQQSANELQSDGFEKGFVVEAH